MISSEIYAPQPPILGESSHRTQFKVSQNIALQAFKKGGFRRPATVTTIGSFCITLAAPRNLPVGRGQVKKTQITIKEY
jgi:hypothetical protein